MYHYTEFDRQFVQARADQYRDQLTRWQAGQLPEDEFRPLRLQNGWYVQRYAPMLRVAVPYGEINAAQIKVLAQIARDYDTPDAALLAEARTAGIPLAGLMCVPPNGVEPAPYFALSAKMAADHGLAGLSMGMSGDFETAIMLGATHVRVGSALFGARD